MSIPEIEKHTIDTYNTKIESFIKSRYSRWFEVENFINSLPDSNILDVGCGSGINMFNRSVDDTRYLSSGHIPLERYPVHNWTGCDYSEKLVQHCQNNGLNVVFADMCDLPFENNQFDAIICIASFHHLSTLERRQEALSEMMRVCKGPILISVLRDTLNCKKVQHIGDGDINFPFQDSERYYHIFGKGEFEKLFFKNVNITCKEHESNYYYIIQKKEPTHMYRYCQEGNFKELECIDIQELDNHCLQLARSYGHFKIVEYLISVDIKANSEHIELALQKGHYKIAKYLTSLGVKIDKDIWDMWIVFSRGYF